MSREGVIAELAPPAAQAAERSRVQRADIAVDTGFGAPTGGEATPRLIRVMMVVGAGYALATLAVLPFAARPGPAIPAVTAAFGSGGFVAALCTAFLMLSQARAERARALLLKSGAYFFSAGMALLHLLTFPGLWGTAGPLIGTMQSAGWAFVAWIIGYPVLIIAGAAAETWAGGWRVGPAGVDRACWIGFAALSAAVAAIAVLVIGVPHRLPEEIHGNEFTLIGRAAQLIAIVLSCAAILLLRKARVGRRALHAWLSLSLVAFISFNMLVAFGGARYTIGWDLSRLSGFFASALLLAFFLRRFARLNRSLARANIRLREANETLEDRVDERTAALDKINRELRQALDERGLLLREVLHRVRNNLQLIDSLIAIQAGAAEARGDEPAGDRLAALRRRINALGLLHQQQMRAEDLSHFDIRPFLDELARQAVAAHPGAGGPGPSGRDRWSKVITVEADPLTVDFDAGIGLGLLASELVSDALNRVGPDAGDGAVRMLLRHGGDGMLSLAVADAGAPAPTRVRAAGKGAAPIGDAASGDDATNSGATIVAALVRQLDGTMTVRRANGTIVEVRMPTPRTAAR